MQSVETFGKPGKLHDSAASHVMYTRCPHCHTYFKIHAEHIKRAAGKVRCGRCFKVFNSIGNLLEQLPVSLENRQPYREPPTRRPSSHPAAAPAAPAEKHDINSDEPYTPNPSSRIEGIRVNATESREMILHPALAELHPAAFNARQLAWSGGLALMLLLFVFQYSYFKREQLVKHETLRPWIESVCAVAHCRIPLLSDINQLELTHRDITSHPKAKNALLISVVISNNAPFAQPFPAMEIRLSDITGHLVARRVFYPEEYLDADVDLRKGLPARSPVQIALEIVDPGKNAVNFEFAFQAAN